MSAFISDYLLSCEHSQPAVEYHCWSMLSTLSVFAGRRFWFPFGPYNYYPNLYVVLVGDPGNGKSSAMNRAKNIVRAAQVCPVAATQITKEALTKKMSASTEGVKKKTPFEGQRFFEHEGREIEYNQYAIFATELVEFISVNPQGFLDFLTTVWDEAILEVETKNKGEDHVMGPYITMLACMTPEKLKGFMKLSILTGGFARRTAFVYAGYKNIVHWPTRTPEQIEAENRCIEFGKALQSRSGPFDITEPCKRFYEDWNTENEKKMSDRTPCTRGWFESKGEMLFKLSMLIALSENGPLVIDVRHYQAALRFCDMLEKEGRLDRVFEGTGINPNAGAATQICHMLERLGRPMNRKHIEMMFFDQVTDMNALRDTITHLISVGRLAERTISRDGRLLGSILGTPEVLGKLSNDECLPFLGRVQEPLGESGTDQSPSDGQPQ